MTFSSSPALPSYPSFTVTFSYHFSFISSCSLVSPLYLFPHLGLPSSPRSFLPPSSQALESDGPNPDLESVCCLELHGGTFKALILDNRMAQAKVSLAQAELTDMRSISMGWVYRTLLCTDRSNSDRRTGWDSMSEREIKFLDVTICSPIEDIIQVDVTVHYALAVIAVDTVKDISDVAMIIAYELLTTVRTAQNHVEDAADRFSAAVKATNYTGSNRNLNGTQSQKTGNRICSLSDLIEVSEDSETTGDTSAPDTPVKGGSALSPVKSMNLRVTLTKAHVALLEDPRKESSSALLLTTGADAQIGFDQWGGVDEESQEALHISLRDVQVHVLSDTGVWLAGWREETMSAPLSLVASVYVSRSTSSEGAYGAEKRSQVSNTVCDPFSLDIHFTRRAVKGVVLASNIAINMGDVNATVSLPYLSLVNSIMLRSGLSGLSSPRPGDLDYYCVFGDRRGDRGTQVDVYVIALNIGKVSIAAVNDVFFTRHISASNAFKVHESAPLVRLHLHSLHLNADGVINPKIYVNSKDVRCTVDVLNIEGIGRLAVGAEFYNPTACHWEPLVEEWGVALSVTKVEQGISCKAVDDSAPLQVNISGIFLDVMINTYAQWMRCESERKAFQPSVKSTARSSVLRRSSIASTSTLHPSPSYTNTEGHTRKRAVSAVQDYDLEEYNSYEESLLQNVYQADSSIQPIPEVEVQGPHLILHNRLLCDLHFKTVGLYNSSSSSSSPLATCPPSPSKTASTSTSTSTSAPFSPPPLEHANSSNFANLFYFSHPDAPAAGGLRGAGRRLVHHLLRHSP